MDIMSASSVRRSVEDLLSDPLIQLVMRADRVPVADLRELLQQVTARRQAPRRALGGPGEMDMSVSSELDPNYRLGVGIMLFNATDDIFVGRRADIPEEEAWQMPQGGIEEGESPRAAALRELREEIGTANVDVLAESKGWLRYDLPSHLVGRAWGGKWLGQQQKWLAMRFLGKDEEINIASEHPEFADWRWVSPGHLPDLIVSFKRQLYLDVFREFGSLGSSVPLRNAPG